MKAGSLHRDDDLGPLRESARSASSGEVCLEVCSRHCSLCLHLFFSMNKRSVPPALAGGLMNQADVDRLSHPLTRMILNSILKSEIYFACVAEQQKHSTVNRASVRTS